MKKKRIFLFVCGGIFISLLFVLLVLLFRTPPQQHLEFPVKNEDAAPISQVPSLSAAEKRMPHRLTKPTARAVDSQNESSKDGAVPPFQHSIAPPAIPSSIKEETDPVKKEALLKQHAHTTIRVRWSVLRRRHNLLSNTLQKAKQDGNWSAEKIRETEEDLQALDLAIQEAKKKLDEAAQ